MPGERRERPMVAVLGFTWGASASAVRHGRRMTSASTRLRAAASTRGCTDAGPHTSPTRGSTPSSARPGNGVRRADVDLGARRASASAARDGVPVGSWRTSRPVRDGSSREHRAPSGALATFRRSSRRRSGTRSGSRLRYGYSTAGHGAAPCDVVRLALKPDPKENGAPAPKRPPRGCYVLELRTRAVRALDGDSQSLLRCRKHVWRARSSYQYEFGREWTDPG